MSKIKSHLMFVDVANQVEHYTFTKQPGTNSSQIQTVTDTGKLSDIIEKSFYKAHLETSQNNSKPIIPSQPIPEEIDNHTIHKRDFRCEICKKFCAETEEKLIQHIRIVHQGESTYQCFMCDYCTDRKYLFHNHIRVHQGSNSFKCSVCGHSSRSKTDLKKHEAIHSSNNPLKCPHCKFIAKRTSSLNKHLMICGQSSINEDVNNVENKNCNRIKMQSNTKNIFACSVCSWSSSSKHRVMLHLVHHPNQKKYPDLDLSILKKYNLLPKTS